VRRPVTEMFGDVTGIGARKGKVKAVTAEV
jgi:hypothetical protein